MNLKNRNLMVVLCGILLVALAFNFFGAGIRYVFLAAFAVVAAVTLSSGWVNGILMALFFNFIYYSLHAETPILDGAVNLAVYAVFVALMEMIRRRGALPAGSGAREERVDPTEKAFARQMTKSIMLAHGMLLEIKDGTSREELLELFSRNVMNLTGASHMLVYLSKNSGDDLELAHSQGALGEREITKKLKHITAAGLSRGNMDAPSADYIKGLKNEKTAAAAIKNEKGGYSMAVLFKDGEFSHSDIYISEFFAAQAFIILEKQEMIKSLAENYAKTVDALVLAIETKDHATHGHCLATMKYAEKIAVKMGLDAAEVEKVKHAALLHDIGKIRVDSGILNKPTALTKEEFEAIKKHPKDGAGILDAMKMFGDILPIVLHHHEHVDGGGYPEKLRGDIIPLGSRICAVADAYSVMLSDRPYRGALSKKEAAAELRRCSGTQFDAAIVDTFIGILENDTGQQAEFAAAAYGLSGEEPVN